MSRFIGHYHLNNCHQFHHHIPLLLIHHHLIIDHSHNHVVSNFHHLSHHGHRHFHHYLNSQWPIRIIGDLFGVNLLSIDLLEIIVLLTTAIINPNLCP